jgi:hypothetical protein
MKISERQRRDRVLYNDLIQLFPPPPHLIQREIRLWLYEEVIQASQEKPGSRLYLWFLERMERLNWEKV